MIRPEPSFAHLRRLTDGGGLFEHAKGSRPRPEHGYRLDDVARALVVTARHPAPSELVRTLRSQYLAFVLAAQAPDGQFHNRRGADLTWRDEPSVDDCWGRALWGLGTAAGAAADAELDDHNAGRALAAFDQGATHRSGSTRAMAFAALGAAAVLAVRPDHAPARELLLDAAAQVDTPSCDATTTRNGWAWPEPRLSYANAVVPEVLLAAGHLLGRPELVERGLHLLGWLLAVQSAEGHLSVVPVTGLGPGEAGPRFHQQPSEVAALADASALAAELTGERRWVAAVRQSVAWFLGSNDSGTPMLDEVSGGGFDGLAPGGRSENQGAEATVALLSTLQADLRVQSRPAEHPRAGALTRP